MGRSSRRGRDPHELDPTAAEQAAAPHATALGPDRLAAVLPLLDSRSRATHLLATQSALGNAGTARLLAGRATVSRALVDDMEQAAAEEQIRVSEMPPPTVAELSTVNDAEQARQQVARVRTARDHLFGARAQYDRELAEAGSSFSEAGAARDNLARVDGYVEANTRTEAMLQSIADISAGSAAPVPAMDGGSSVDATVGAEMRHGVFTNLFLTLNRDFARMQGVVSAFITAHPGVADAPGSAGGEALGSALAGGSGAHEKIAGGMKGELPVLVSTFRTVLETYTKADYAKTVDTALYECGLKAAGLRNTTADVSMPPVREDSPEVRAAAGTVTAINADLAAARSAIDRTASVVKLAAAAVAMPQIGALGAGSALEGPMETVGTGMGHLDTGVGAVKTLTDVDLKDTFQNELAKILTDYDSRITSARGKLSASQYLQQNAVAQLDAARLGLARKELEFALQRLRDLIDQIETRKKAIRAAASAIADYQARQGGKGGPDIAAISLALGEVTIFLEQASATKLQGVKERAALQEMVRRRQALAGGYAPDAGGSDLLGNRVIATTEGGQTYYDAEQGGERWFFRMVPIQFTLWSDKASQTPDATYAEIDTILTQIDEYTATAEGFKKPLNQAMFG